MSYCRRADAMERCSLISSSLLVLFCYFGVTRGFSREDFESAVVNQKQYSGVDYLPFVQQYSRAWLDGLIPTAVANVSEQCKLDSIVYRDALSTAKSPWALQMFDATGKLPDGILGGNFHALGDYEQCLRVRPDPEAGDWRGKYCQVFLWIAAPSEKMFNMWFFQQIASGAPLDPGDPMVYTVQQPSFGVCLPSSCSAEDISTAITGMSTGNSSINGLGFTGTTMEGFCSVDKDEPYVPDDGAIAMLVVLAVLGFLIVCGTVIDMAKEYNLMKQSEGLIFRVLKAFSLISNGSKLLSTKRSGEDLSCLHGLRFLSFTWVLIGHAFTLMIFPTANLEALYDQMRDSAAFQAIPSGVFAVDSFFFMTGLLLAYLFLKAMKKTGNKWGITPQVNPLMLIVHRFLRLTPAYALIIGFYVNIWPHLSDGPGWQSVKFYTDQCRTQWWGNLLYIQKYVFDYPACLSVTWYLAVEFQIFVPATLFVWLMYRYERIGVALTAVVTLLGGILGAVYMSVWDMPPIAFTLNKANLQFEGLNEYLNHYYQVFWFRYPPFFVGMIFGWILYKVKQPDYVKPLWLKPGISRLLALLGWLMSGAAAASVVYGLYGYSDGDPEMPPEVQIIYGGFSHTIWAICVGWVVFACDTGYGGPINTFLSWKPFMVLGRLTFCAYLIHVDWMTFYLSFARSPMYYSSLTVVYTMVGHLSVTLLLATIATLAFEAPFLNIEKMIFATASPRKGADTIPPNRHPSILEEHSAMNLQEKLEIPRIKLETGHGFDNSGFESHNERKSQ